MRNCRLPTMCWEPLSNCLVSTGSWYSAKMVANAFAGFEESWKKSLDKNWRHCPSLSLGFSSWHARRYLLAIQKKSNGMVEKQGLSHELREGSRKLIDERRAEKINTKSIFKSKKGYGSSMSYAENNIVFEQVQKRGKGRRESWSWQRKETVGKWLLKDGEEELSFKGFQEHENHCRLETWGSDASKISTELEKYVRWDETKMKVRNADGSNRMIQW